MNSPKIELPTGYYHVNFCHILRNGLERYPDLLTSQELAFAAGFYGMPEDAQKIYIRLVSRLGPWFRSDKLKYPELASASSSLQTAHVAGYFVNETHASLDDLLDLLNLDELKGLLKKIVGSKKGAVPSGLRKEELVVFAQNSVSVEVLKQELSKIFSAFAPQHSELLKTYFLLFFGNLSQDATEFVLQDLGVVVYEKYSLEKELRLFQTREHIDHRLDLATTRDEVFAFLENAELDEALVRVKSLLARKNEMHASVHRRVCKLVNEVARGLERAQRLDEALSLYLCSHVPPARERAVRIYAKQGFTKEAAAVAAGMLETPRDEPERQFAQKYLKRLDEVCEPEVRTFELTRKHRRAIESQLIEHMRGQGTPCFFTENHLWNSLFGLAFWDIIFAPVAGVFAHPFQRGPLDQYSRDFGIRRQDLLQTRVVALREGSFGRSQFMEVFTRKYGVANNFVFWAEGVREQVDVALERLTSVQLAGILERMATDIKRYGNGFPDLFVCQPEPQNFELWEVKGPGDTLRAEQKTWITFFASLGIQVVLAKVVWKN